ncbi:MAG: hypothetical protein ACRD6B_01665 [Bryobacteraceae bacterium]
MGTTPAVASNPLGETSTQVVVLAFDLAGREMVNFPSLLEKSLSDKKVQSAIQSALDDFILKRMAAGAAMNDLTGKDALDLLSALGHSAGGKLEAAALNQIKASPDYKSLEKAIADFEKAVKATPMGVWVDRHSGMLFVTGLVLVLGGAAVLYATRTSGGAVTSAAVGQLKGKPFKVFKVGKFTMQGQLLAFQPDKRILGAGTVFTEKWKSVQVSVSLGVIAAAASVQKINGSLILKTHPFDLTLKASDQLNKKTVNLALSLGFENGPLKPLKVRLGAVLTGGKVTGETLNASLKTAAGDFGLNMKATTKEYQGLATWTLHFSG